MSFEPLIPVGLSLFSSERGNKRWRKTKGERPFPWMKNTNICRIFRALFPQMDVLTLAPMCEPVRGCSCMCRPDGAALRNNAARGGGEENGLSNLDGKPRRTLRGRRRFRPSPSCRGSNAGLMASSGEGGKLKAQLERH